MTKITCDKCGKEITNRIMVDLPCEEHQSRRLVCGVWIKSYDLCADCFNKLKKWIDEE